MESKLFNCILSNPRHVLYQLLPPEKDTGYNLRQRSHHLTLAFTDNNNDQEEFSAQNVIYGYLLGVCVGVGPMSTYWCMYV